MLTRDVLWKGIIEDLFEDFLAYFFPDVVGQFDLARGFDFLDKELAELFPESENTTPKNQAFTWVYQVLYSIQQTRNNS